MGHEAKTGKSLGTDLAQQKLTLPLIRLLHVAAPDVATEVRNLLRQPSPLLRQRLATLFEETDAKTYAVRSAERHAAAARSELDCLPFSDSRQVLDELTRKVVHRSH